MKEIHDIVGKCLSELPSLPQLTQEDWDEIWANRPWKWEKNDGEPRLRIPLEDDREFVVHVEHDADWQGEETGYVDMTNVFAYIDGVEYDHDGLDLYADYQSKQTYPY